MVGHLLTWLDLLDVIGEVRPDLFQVCVKPLFRLLRLALRGNAAMIDQARAVDQSRRTMRRRAQTDGPASAPADFFGTAARSAFYLAESSRPPAFRAERTGEVVKGNNKRTTTMIADPELKLSLSYGAAERFCRPWRTCPCGPSSRLESSIPTSSRFSGGHERRRHPGQFAWALGLLLRDFSEGVLACDDLKSYHETSLWKKHFNGPSATFLRWVQGGGKRTRV